ncbi:MAG: hypothetical protein J6B37_03315 [Clostridia bacterium]|nr:hypothetical protein [Clostridia bacterium]
MTDYQKIYDGISKAIWGYFFLYFNISLGTISILPSFVGYILFLKAIDLLEDEERELSLLKTLGLILAVWDVVEWLANCIGYSFNSNWKFVTLIVGLVNLYFHFQFITNIASIAKKHQWDGCMFNESLLRYRTAQTILLTVILVISNFNFLPDELWIYIPLAISIIYLIVGIYIMIVLNQLRKNLKTNETIADEDNIEA